MRTLLLTLTTCLFVLPAQAKYSGGTGEPNDPYQIATAADLIGLGETPADYDKHFILTADIDLDPNLPGGKVFDRAVIASNPSWKGTPFTGVFDGSGHRIWHLSIQGKNSLGIFGQLGPAAEVKDLGVVNVNIAGSGDHVGGLVGRNEKGTVTHCYSTGAVSGIGENGSSVGGQVGSNGGIVTRCYSTGAVSGSGDLVYIGGLVGNNYAGQDSPGTVIQCYSTGTINGGGESMYVGGLVGRGSPSYVAACLWDIERSGQAESAGGRGLTTAEMYRASTFFGWGGCGCGPVWTIAEGEDYPHLAWESMPGQAIATALTYGGGGGTVEDPYLIYTAEELNAVGGAICDLDKHFKLMADIDLSGFDGKKGRPAFSIIGTSDANPFRGVFDGNDHTISHLTIGGGEPIGLFAYLESGAEVKQLGVVDVNIGIGSNDPDCVGGAVVGDNHGAVTQCYSTGVVSGGFYYNGFVGGLVGENHGTVIQCFSTTIVNGLHNASAGGLVGWNRGAVTQCYSTGAVSGTSGVGGLVGYSDGHVTQCYSTGAVSGGGSVGGLVGYNNGTVTECYSTGTVSGSYSGSYLSVGGLVGANFSGVTQCYSTGAVSGSGSVGGLVGSNWDGTVTQSFWDIETSGQATSVGGTGKTTAEMQTARVFLEAGWDFMGETRNGTEDTWWINEGHDYPSFVSVPCHLSPDPRHGAADVGRGCILSWHGEGEAIGYEVYFGRDPNLVANATRESQGVYRGRQTADVTHYDPGLLEWGQTYYWRVDEVDAAPDSTIYRGTVWTFTVETFVYPVKPIKATASSFSNILTQPGKTIDGSGLGTQDRHSIDASQMWLSKKNVTPIWIQYEFDSVYKLYQMWVWNQNQLTEPDYGLGAKEVTIEASTDGNTWTVLEGVPEFVQAPGDDTYVHNTTVDFGGVTAKYVKLNILSNWGGLYQAGLSEVRFFHVPVRPFGPTPPSGATDVALDAVLNWRPGREAVKHEVYVSSDREAVAKGTALVQTVTEHSFSLAPLALEYGKTYYWKVNEAATPGTLEGDVWSFSTRVHPCGGGL